MIEVNRMISVKDLTLTLNNTIVLDHVSAEFAEGTGVVQQGAVDVEKDSFDHKISPVPLL